MSQHAVEGNVVALAPSQVPVIDLGPFISGTPEERQRVAEEVGAACESIGFLVITNHGVAQASIDEMYETTRRFFEQPLEDKLVAVSPVGDFYQGYAPPAVRSECGEVRRRFVEAFHANPYDTPQEAIAAGYPEGVVNTMAANVWPDDPPDFVAVWRRYYREMELLANRMFHVFAMALGLPEDWFDDKVDRHLAALAANHYLPQDSPPRPDELRLQAHVDFGCLTILYQDDAPGGLQVHQRGAGWQDIPAIAGSYVVNLGDMMSRWTNERWVATPHRVVNPPTELLGTTRISIPFFHHPNHDAVIEAIPTCVSLDDPAKYDPIVGGDWIEARRRGLPPDSGRRSVAS